MACLCPPLTPWLGLPSPGGWQQAVLVPAPSTNTAEPSPRLPLGRAGRGSLGSTRPTQTGHRAFPSAEPSLGEGCSWGPSP